MLVRALIRRRPTSRIDRHHHRPDLLLSLLTASSSSTAARKVIPATNPSYDPTRQRRAVSPAAPATTSSSVVPSATTASANDKRQHKPYTDDQTLQDGAWTLLAALEKVREAEGVRVSRLLSSLEALLPRPVESAELGLHHPSLEAQTGHTSDPAFFKLPDAHNPNGTDIAHMLRSTRRGRRIDLSTVESLLSAATSHFRQRPSVVTLPALSNTQKLHVIGDLHGSLSDLEAVLGLTGEPSSPNNLVLFNGDFADRGDNGIEIISMVCALSLAYPDCVFANRGNHEDLALSVGYGLGAEIKFKYGKGIFRNRLAPLLDGFFMSLPLATVVERDAFIVHAGPPPPGIELKTMQDSFRWDGCGVSRTVRTKRDHNEINWGKDGHFESFCAQDHAVEEMLESMLWSDPDIDEFDGSLFNSNRIGNVTPVWSPNLSRGAGYRFDAQILRQFLTKSGLKRLIRSHEPVQNGCLRYEIIPDDVEDSEEQKGQPLEFFTVFSASRYPHKEGFNYGAVLSLSAGSGHRIVRYATEDDDPLMSVADLLKKDQQKLLAKVDATALRRSLRAAIATRRIAFESKLEDVARWRGEQVDSLPFEDATDALFATLNLRGEGLLQDGPRRALALALKPDLAKGELPLSIDILSTLDSFAEEDGANDEYNDFDQTNEWLQELFALIDVSKEGWISQEEWQAAIITVNSNLPPKAEKIDAIETWNLLDQSGDGQLSHWEWNALGRAYINNIK